MTGCFVRLGCLVVLVTMLIIGWLTQDRWLPQLTGRRAAVVAPPPGWEPVTEAAASRASAAFAQLSKPRGPAFVTLTPGEVASYFFRFMTREPKVRTDSVAAMGSGDRISVRANLQMASLKDLSVLGPISNVFSARERLELTGTIRLVRPSRIRVVNGVRQFVEVGIGEFQVQELKIRNIPIPRALIPRLIREINPEKPIPGVAPDALPFPIQYEVSDIRVSNGKIVLYKATN